MAGAASAGLWWRGCGHGAGGMQFGGCRSRAGRRRVARTRAGGVQDVKRASWVPSIWSLGGRWGWEEEDNFWGPRIKDMRDRRVEGHFGQ